MEYKKQPKLPLTIPPKVSSCKADQNLTLDMLHSEPWETDSHDRQLYEENKQYLDPLHPGLRPLLFENLKKLRAKQTPAEAKDDPFGRIAWKKKLLEMPPWSDEEIRVFDESIASFKNWKIEEW